MVSVKRQYCHKCVLYIPLKKKKEMNMFPSVSGYEYEMVHVQVEVVLCLVEYNLLRVHSRSVQAANTLWVSAHMLALPKQDMAKRDEKILGFFPPGLKYASKTVSGKGTRMRMIPMLDLGYGELNRFSYWALFWWRMKATLGHKMLTETTVLRQMAY